MTGQVMMGTRKGIQSWKTQKCIRDRSTPGVLRLAPSWAYVLIQVQGAACCPGSEGTRLPITSPSFLYLIHLKMDPKMTLPKDLPEALHLGLMSFLLMGNFLPKDLVVL